MASRNKNIVIDIGADYSSNVYAYANGSTTTPLNLTGYTSANGHVKTSYYVGDTSAIFNVAIQDATAGIINLHLNRANSVTLSPGKYVYDVMIKSPSGLKTRILEGILTATPGVSR